MYSIYLIKAEMIWATVLSVTFILHLFNIFYVVSVSNKQFFLQEIKSALLQFANETNTQQDIESWRS